MTLVSVPSSRNTIPQLGDFLCIGCRNIVYLFYVSFVIPGNDMVVITCNTVRDLLGIIGITWGPVSSTGMTVLFFENKHWDDMDFQVCNFYSVVFGV